MPEKKIEKKSSEIVSSKSSEKQKRIKKKFNILKRIFKDLEGNLLKVACDLIQNAAFMAVTMEDLQEIINEKGATEEYRNGENQKGIKKSSEVEVYNTMAKNYSGYIRQLTDMLPKEAADKVKVDEFDKFVKAR